MSRTFLASCLAAVALNAGLSGTLCAGSMMVAPTRIELTARKPIATLEVSNDGDDAITVQLENLAWTQAAGADVYTLSSELIATPTVFDVAPHSSQVLRIALRNKNATPTEHAFRVYAAEVPSAARLRSSGLQMVLRIGVPVFVEAANGEAHLTAEIAGRADGIQTLRLHNTGGHFVHAVKVQLSSGGGAQVFESNNPGYVLAGGEHEWPLATVAGLPPDGLLHVSVTTETGVEHLDARASP